MNRKLVGKILIFCLLIVSSVFVYQYFNYQKTSSVFAALVNSSNQCLTPDGFLSAISGDGNCLAGTIPNFDLTTDANLEDLLGSLGGVAGFGDISQFINQFAEMGGAIEDIIGGNYTDISGLLNALPGGANLSQATAFLGILGGTGSSGFGFDIDDILAPETGFGSLSNLFGSLNSYSNSNPNNLAALNGSLSTLALSQHSSELLTRSGGSLSNLLKDDTDPHVILEGIEPPFADPTDPDGEQTTTQEREEADADKKEQATEELENTHKQDDETDCREEAGGAGGGGADAQSLIDAREASPELDRFLNDVTSGEGIDRETLASALANPGSFSAETLVGAAGQGFQDLIGEAGINLGSFANAQELLSQVPVVGEALGAIAGGLDLTNLTSLTGLIGEIPGIGAIMERIPVLGDILGGGLGGIIPGIPGLGIGMYVPVREVEGTLMDLTRETRDLTKDTNELTVEICKHTKAIKRIQQKFEMLEFVDRPAARREAFTALEEYKGALINFLNTDYVGEGEGESESPELFVANQQQYDDEGAREATNRILAQLKNSNSPYRDTLLNDFKLNQQTAGFANSLACSITPEELQAIDNPRDTSIPIARKAQIMSIMFTEPACSVNGAYLLTRNEIEKEKIREQERRDSFFVASGGYKPIRECVDGRRDENGNCLEYRIKTPASALGANVNAALATRRDRFVNNPELDDVEEGRGPELAEIQEGLTTVENQPRDGGGGGGGGDEDGGLPSGFDIDQFIDNSNRSDAIGDDITSDNLSLPDFNIPPMIFSFFRTPSVSQLNGDLTIPNNATIYWASPNATSCKTGNTWVDSLFHDSINIIHENNTEIRTAGQQTFIYPMSFEIKLTHHRLTSETDLSASVSVIPLVDKINQITTITINAALFQKDDILTLGLKRPDDLGSFDEVSIIIPDNSTQDSIINGLRTAIDNKKTNNNSEFRKYAFDYPTGQGKITITAVPIYTITCENDSPINNGTNSETITITR